MCPRTARVTVRAWRYKSSHGPRQVAAASQMRKEKLLFHIVVGTCLPVASAFGMSVHAFSCAPLRNHLLGWAVSTSRTFRPASTFQIARRNKHVIKSNKVARPCHKEFLAQHDFGAGGMSTSSFSEGLDIPDTYQRYQGEIFCNRALNMKRIRAVGFDMDYTLAQYIPETFEILAHRGAMEKLVNHMGYPKEILNLPDYDPTFFQRGLIIDKQRGNIIKMDRHMYVKIAYHGMRALSTEERRASYGQLNQKSFSSETYANIDTLFSLPDAFMFCQLVDFKDAHSEQFSVMREKTYAQIYKDVRRSVDLCHRDGVIKDKVSAEPERYIQAEPGIVNMLKRFKLSGRKVFLVTNSLWEYTNTVMNHINGNSRREHWTLDWLDLFDLVIVGACKPGFLEDPYLPLFRVHTEDGRLGNMDNALFDPPAVSLAQGKVFQGGNWQHLHYLMGDAITSGEQVMYVGDHMFSDVIRGKRSLGWRTALVVPELAHEVDVSLQQSVRWRRISELRELRDELDEWVDRLSLMLSACEADSGCVLTPKVEQIAEELKKAQGELTAVKSAFSAELRSYHTAFHPIWGQMFKVGYQNSRFAQQVQSYACLYTSKVSNLGLVSPEMNFRTQSDLMPHDQLEDTPLRRMLKARGNSIIESFDIGPLQIQH